jgi:hypothetical protein
MAKLYHSIKVGISLSLLFLIFFQSGCVFSQTSGPFWLKEGKYASYGIYTPVVFFLNGTGVRVEGDSDGLVTYSWRCSGLNGTIAQIEINLSFTNNNGTGFNFKKNVSINAYTRQVYFLDGTLIGQTLFWASSFPLPDDRPVLVNSSSNNILGAVDGAENKKPLYHSSPQGMQRIFEIIGNGTFAGQTISYLSLLYDYDTGVMLTSYPMICEATLAALGIKNPFGAPVLKDTNIDLGPRELSFDIRSAVPIIAVISAFSVGMVGFYYANRKRRRHSKRNND